MDTKNTKQAEIKKASRFDPISQDIEQVGKSILDAAFRVHRNLGPGLLESVYEACLAHEIRKSGRKTEIQVPLPVVYDNVQIEAGFRMDLLVEKSVVVEIKAVETLAPVHEAQLLTYLRLSGIRLGYLINFSVVRLKDGIKRMVV